MHDAQGQPRFAATVHPRLRNRFPKVARTEANIGSCLSEWRRLRHSLSRPLIADSAGKYVWGAFAGGEAQRDLWNHWMRHVYKIATDDTEKHTIRIHRWERWAFPRGNWSVMVNGKLYGAASGGRQL